MLRLIPEITAERENFRIETHGNIGLVRRDPVEPVPVGSFVVMVFQVTGYDPDCDGSLMARLAHVGKDGKASGWEPRAIGLYPDYSVSVDAPADVWEAAQEGGA